MENEFSAAVTAKTAAHAELAASRLALRTAERNHYVAATRLRNGRGDADWTARLKTDQDVAQAELEEAKQRLADAVTLMQRASELTKPFLEGSL